MVNPDRGTQRSSWLQPVHMIQYQSCRYQDKQGRNRNAPYGPYVIQIGTPVSTPANKRRSPPMPTSPSRNTQA